MKKSTKFYAYAFSENIFYNNKLACLFFGLFYKFILSNVSKYAKNINMFRYKQEKNYIIFYF